MRKWRIRFNLLAFHGRNTTRRILAGELMYACVEECPTYICSSVVYKTRTKTEDKTFLNLRYVESILNAVIAYH